MNSGVPSNTMSSIWDNTPFASDIFGSAKDLFGSKPVIPTLPTLGEAQKTAISSNQANLGDIAKLATGVNTLNQDQLNLLIDRTLGPGVRQQVQANLASQLKGEIPQDVQSAIYRGVAERSAGSNAFGGGASSGFDRNITARDLGLTSLDITNKALSSAESWLSKAQAPAFDATAMFISPAQQNAANQDQFNRNLLAAKVAAAPDPATRGSFDAFMSVLGEVLSVYSGGAGYKNTYNPDSVYGGGGGGGPGPGGGGGGGMYIPQTNYYNTPPNQGVDGGGGGGLGGLAAMFA